MLGQINAHCRNRFAACDRERAPVHRTGAAATPYCASAQARRWVAVGLNFRRDHQGFTRAEEIVLLTPPQTEQRATSVEVNHRVIAKDGGSFLRRSGMPLN